MLLSRMEAFTNYRSPLSTRYASKEMQYNFSEMKKFTTWRKLWVLLALAQKDLYSCPQMLVGAVGGPSDAIAAPHLNSAGTSSGESSSVGNSTPGSSSPLLPGAAAPWYGFDARCSPGTQLPSASDTPNTGHSSNPDILTAVVPPNAEDLPLSDEDFAQLFAILSDISLNDLLAQYDPAEFASLFNAEESDASS